MEQNQRSVDKTAETQESVLFTFEYKSFIMYELAGCGSVWLECTAGGREVAGSNPVTPSATNRTGRSGKAGVFCLKDWNLIELSMGIL